tara:strand:- start:2151 stop:2504 length:354 start_codon:yes stop_codon:yes gene_type:complete
MRNLFITAMTLMSISSFAQAFQPITSINGVLYRAVENTLTHATYIQDDNFEFGLAADSFYVDEMDYLQWDAYSGFLKRNQDAVFRNGIYLLNDGCHVFTHESDNDKLLVIRLFGSQD